MRKDYTPYISKSFQMRDHFFPLQFPKDSKSLIILDIQIWKVESKRLLNGTSKSELTDRQTHRQTYGHFNL